jgi:hypothetical protein
MRVNVSFFRSEMNIAKTMILVVGAGVLRLKELKSSVEERLRNDTLTRPTVPALLRAVVKTGRKPEQHLLRRASSVKDPQTRQNPVKMCVRSPS